jgi:hypothetical protein
MPHRDSDSDKCTCLLLTKGTPVNTSLMDLYHQLEFLGIEKAAPILSELTYSTLRHINDRNMNKGLRRSSVTAEMPKLGNFTFLMRSIMMRHSQKQMYRDTSTTLMSLPPKVKYRFRQESSITVRPVLIAHSARSDLCSYVSFHRRTVQSLSTFPQPTEANTIPSRRLHAPTISR